MSKRFLSVILTLVMTLELLPCQAAEVTPTPAEEVYALSPDTGFLDVKDGDWFAPYVDVCVKAGLMNGVGDGLFAPGKTLSQRECAILALRLHQMGQGGNGVFDPAPVDWDYALLTLADGTVISQGYLGGEASGMDLHWTSIDRYARSALGFYLNTEDDRAWGLEMDFQPVTLTASGTAYAGALHLTTQRDILYFLPDEGVDDSPLRDGIPFQAGTGWWRDGWYYARQNGLGKLLGGEAEDFRTLFAYRIAAVTDLPAINDIADNAVPDLDPRSTVDQDALRLYRAGVLNGVDSQGTFAGSKALTRAEAAAMLARVLKPELRLRFALPTVKDGTEE